MAARRPAQAQADPAQRPVQREKFTEAGGKVTLRAWYNADSGFVFQVSDTGIGMAPEDIPKALSQFGRIDGKLNRSV